jgi:hypothetical protein
VEFVAFLVVLMTRFLMFVFSVITWPLVMPLYHLNRLAARRVSYLRRRDCLNKPICGKQMDLIVERLKTGRHHTMCNSCAIALLRVWRDE